MIWRWFKKKVLRMADKEDLKMEKEKTQKSPTLPNGDPLPASLIDERKKKQLRKFEIQIFDEDLQDDGTINLKPVKMERATILEVATPEELKMALQQYRMCGQVAKIVREIDPPSTLPQQSQPIQQVNPPTTATSNIQYQPAVFPNISTTNEIQPQSVAMPKPKPKIVTIGDMQVKYDGDKVYQKQWVKLNTTEAANFRVVSDSSNKIVSLAGKHIEAKRWVRVEESSEDSVDDAVEAILAGN